jgi:hypothetical protein
MPSSVDNGRRVVILDRWTGATVAIEPYESIAQAFARKSEIDDGPSESQAFVTALDEKTLVAVGPRRAIAIEARALEKLTELGRPPPPRKGADFTRQRPPLSA